MKYFRVILWLIALHSFIVAMLLIFLPEEGIRYFGFTDGNPFFQVQGGVFHIVMCIAYVMAAIDLSSGRKLIIFIIGAKSLAFLYLMIYFIFIDPIPILLISGIGDGIMALVVYLLWVRSMREVADG